jgi:hypothetical protein
VTSSVRCSAKHTDSGISIKENKQFFEIYWSKSQLEARSHPNVLAAQKWLNSLYHSKGAVTSPVSLSTPLSYADRFRIREPSSFQWTAHPPHIDGGSVERWEDDGFRKCFEDILKGDWRSHDRAYLSFRVP